MKEKYQGGQTPTQPKEENILDLLLHYDLFTCSGYKLFYIEKFHTAHKEYDGTQVKTGTESHHQARDISEKK